MRWKLQPGFGVISTAANLAEQAQAMRGQIAKFKLCGSGKAGASA